MANKTEIVIIAAHAEGRILSETWDLAAFARQLNNDSLESIEALVLADNPDSMAEAIAEQTGLNVRAISCPGLDGYASEVYRAVLERELTRNGNVSYICAPHNSQGMDYAPALAASLDAACISGVNGLVREEGAVFFQKDVYGGKVKANMVSNTETTVLTVQPGIFRFDPGHLAVPGRVTRVEARFTPSRTRIKGVRKTGADSAGITDARVVVAAGRGIGEQENIDMVKRLAGLFPKSAVAGTRIVCDRGWLPYSHQVGVTGISVAPELYVACGVSGASQHVMGMRGARFVVAINTDPHAAMFNESDICIVEDIKSFIPLLLETGQEPSNHNTVPGAPDNEKPGG